MKIASGKMQRKKAKRMRKRDKMFETNDLLIWKIRSTGVVTAGGRNHWTICSSAQVPVTYALVGASREQYWRSIYDAWHYSTNTWRIFLFLIMTKKNCDKLTKKQRLWWIKLQFYFFEYRKNELIINWNKEEHFQFKTAKKHCSPILLTMVVHY